MSVKQRLAKLEQGTPAVRFMVWTSTLDDVTIFENAAGEQAAESEIDELTPPGVKPIVVAYVDEPIDP